MLANHTSKKLLRQVFLPSLFITSCLLAADDSGDATIGTMATKVSSTFKDIGQMIIGIAFVAGLGFGVAAIFKFKQHKDNPQQNTVGTALTILSLSIGLVFISGFYKPLGRMMFGNHNVDRYVAGHTGDYSYDEEAARVRFH